MDSEINGNFGTDAQTKVSARKKEKNYNREEDIFLCRAWITTSRGPEEEMDQSSTTLWGRIGDKYASLIGNNYAIRPGHSLPQRWSKIRAAVSTFCAIYKSINDQNPNNYTEQDMIKMALLSYKKEKKEKFKFFHCWTELRNSFEWNSEGDLKVRVRNVAQQSPMDENLSHDDDNDYPMPTDMLEQLDRQKLEKQCEGKNVEAVICTPCTKPSPLSAVSPIFICSSGVINFDPNGHMDTDVQTEGDEQVKTKKRESNYKREEDVLLCRAWMGIMKAREESSIVVWERIVEKFVSLIGSNQVTRTATSLTHRWHKMRHAVLKFSVIYETVNDQSPTGYTEHDKINKARVIYRKDGTEKFRFHHCWTVLRHSPKWNEVVRRGRLRIGAMYSQETITSENSGFDDDYGSPMTIDTSSEQLDGNLPEEQQVGCGEGESASPTAASSRLLALCTPVILSRDVNYNTHNHVGKDGQTEVGEKVNTKKRETNYSEEEDIFLCRAWMATDMDPVIGKDRSSMTLWGRLGEAYASLIGNNYVPRTVHSLANRWSRIRNTVAKFYSIYKNIADQNQESSDLEKINMAAVTFKKECKERFIFLGCWNELKHSPKWNFEIESGVKFRRRHAAVLSQQSSNVEHSSHNNDDDDDDDDYPVPTPMLFDQPQVEKLVPQKRKGQDADTSDMEELLPQTQNLVREIYADQPEVEKLVVRKRKERDGETDLVRELLEQKVKKLDELLEIEREKRDTKIMLIDPTTLLDGRRLYFEKLQQKILERVCGIPTPRN